MIATIQTTAAAITTKTTITTKGAEITTPQTNQTSAKEEETIMTMHITEAETATGAIKQKALLPPHSRHS